MVTEGITIAIITGGLAVLSNVIVAAFNSTKTIYRIDQLEKKVEKHNQLIERTYKLETQMDEATEQLDDVKSDIKEVWRRLP